MRLLAALCFGIASALVAGVVVGLPLRLRPWRTERRVGHESWDERLRQSGVRVTALQFVAGSVAAGVTTIALVAAITGSVFVGVVPAIAVAATPAAYFSRRRARVQHDVQAAWPDALRDVLASIAAGRSLAQACHELGEHGPEPLRDAFARVAGRTRMTGLGPALEAAKAELADPVSDRVLEVILLAEETGGATVRIVLSDLVASITKDLEVAEQIETDGLEMRINARSVVALPWFVLVALTAGHGPFRDFYRSGAGVATIAIGLVLSAVGFLLVNRLAAHAARARACSEDRRRDGPGAERRRPKPRTTRSRRDAGGRSRMSAAVVLASGCISVACALVARLLVPPTARLAPRVRPYVVASRSRLGHPPSPLDVDAVPPGGPFGRLFGPPVVAAARRVGRLVESRSDGHLELRLRQAGLVDVSVDEHRVRQVAQGTLAAIVGGAVGAVVLRTPVATLAVAAGAGFWGVTRARAAVDRAIEERAERIRLELPTIAQLLALHVRAGAGPMQAVQRVVARGRGAVVDELDAALRRARGGGREADAFRAVAAASPEPSAARLYELFAISVERGADLAEGLLALGSQLREARREEVRKQAVRRRAAMLLPTIGILAPIMLLFIAAPLPSIVLGHH